jgi:hypothetical protein
MKLNEIIGKILEVKNIWKMFKNHAGRSPYESSDMRKKVDLKKT